MAEERNYVARTDSAVDEILSRHQEVRARNHGELDAVGISADRLAQRARMNGTHAICARVRASAEGGQVIEPQEKKPSGKRRRIRL